MINNIDLDQLLMTASGTFERLNTGQLIDLLYTQSGVGCCLHIVTDDYNYEDSHVEYCLNYARKNNHALCIEIAERLSALTEAERIVVLNVPDYALDLESDR